eukprot:6642917-Karenia_brevis.AAC.1
MKISLSNSCLDINLWPVNVLASTQCDATLLEKSRFPAAVGGANDLAKRLCANFMCRRSRWQQLKLTPEKAF